MTDREKLIEVLLRGCKETADKNAVPLCSEEYCKENREECFGDLINLLLANGVTFATDNNVGGKWIPVTERLPGTEKVLITDGEIVMACGSTVLNRIRCGKTYPCGLSPIGCPCQSRRRRVNDDL